MGCVAILVELAPIDPNPSRLIPTHPRPSSLLNAGGRRSGVESKISLVSVDVGPTPESGDDADVDGCSRGGHAVGPRSRRKGRELDGGGEKREDRPL